MCIHISEETLEDYEMYFKKEKLDKGYVIIESNKQNSFMYVILKGKVNMMIDTHNLDKNQPFPHN